MENCKGKIEEISLLVDSELDAEQEAELRAHIAECHTCKTIYNSFLAISSSIGDELVEPPEMLAKGIMFKINNRKSSKKRHFAFGSFTAIAACLAVILLGAGKFGLLDSFKPNTAESFAAPRDAAVHLEGAAVQNDDTLENAPNETSDNKLDGDGEAQPNTEVYPTYGGNSNDFINGGNNAFTAFGIPPEARLADAAKKEIALLIMDTAEVSIYKGDYMDENDKVISANLLMSITNDEALDSLASILIFTDADAPNDSYVETLKPAFTLLIPKDDSSSDRMEDIIVPLWFDNKNIICRDSKSNALHLTEGSMEDFLKFIDTQKQTNKIM